MSENLDLEALRLQLAVIEHERWADWQRWMHGQCARLESGELVIPVQLVERWERQIKTPYDQLNGMEQASDMEQVDRYWPLIVEPLERHQHLLNVSENVDWAREIARRLHDLTKDMPDAPEPKHGPDCPMCVIGPALDALGPALERVPELERQVANLEADLHSQDADYWRQRAEQVEAAARPVAYADVRVCALCRPDRYHEHAPDCPVMALRAALADAPAADPKELQ